MRCAARRMLVPRCTRLGPEAAPWSVAWFEIVVLLGCCDLSAGVGVGNEPFADLAGIAKFAVRNGLVDL